MMDKLLFEALEQSLERLEEGQSLDVILAAYPDLAEVLRPLLEAARVAIETRAAAPSTEILQRSRARLLAQASALRPVSSGTRGWIPRIASAFAVAAVILLASGGLIAAAAAQSLPGDSLYAVKRTAERVSLMLSPEAKREVLRDEFRERRTEETRALLDVGRSEEANLFGTLSSRNGNQITIAGIKVEVRDDVEGAGEIEIGDLLEVDGRTTGRGLMVAANLERLAFELKGDLQISSDGTWSIEGLQIETSYIVDREGFKTGESVKARLELDDDGSYRVIRLEPLPRELDDNHGDDLATDDHQAGGSGGTNAGQQEISIHGTLQTWTQAYLQVSDIYFLIGAGSEIETGLTIGDQVHVEAIKIGSGPYVITKAERAGEDDQLDDEVSPSGEDEREPEGGHESGSDPDEPEDDEHAGDDD